MSFGIEQLSNEVKFVYSRSSGPGGQHVNKTNTKVILEFDIDKSALFDENQKTRLFKQLKTRLTKNKLIQLKIDAERSQLSNRQIGLKRLKALLDEGLEVPKKRLPKKVHKAAKIKRLKDKKNHSEKKKNRSFNPDL